MEFFFSNAKCLGLISEIEEYIINVGTFYNLMKNYIQILPKHSWSSLPTAAAGFSTILSESRRSSGGEQKLSSDKG